jgi:two-component system phosphate regulon sensor histidine kinase PhoR
VDYIWSRAALWVAVSAGLGLLAWLSIGAVAGASLFAAALTFLLIRQLLQLQRITAWAKAPRLGGVPNVAGIWEELASAVAKLERDRGGEFVHLNQLLRRYRRVVQAMPDGVVVLDQQFRIDLFNAVAEEHLGLNRGHDIGQPIVNLVRHPDFIAYIERADFSEPLRLSDSRKQGQILSLRFDGFGHGEMLLQTRDITRFERADAMRRDFVANVSHELKTPLTVLSGFLETLLDPSLELSPAERRRFLGLMQANSSHLQHIVDDLLTLSRLEDGSQELREEAVDVASLVNQVAHEGEILSAGRHSVRVQIDQPAEVNGNEHELRSAFANLVYNAVRYTPDGGSILVGWRLEDDRGAFYVQDTGVGIDAADLPRITERFYRADKSRSRATGGTGLGLSIVKHVLTRHQGELAISSTVGHGSCFTAWLPAERVKALPVEIDGELAAA